MTVGTVCVSGGVMRSCMNYGGRRQIGQSGMKKVYYEWLRCIACFMVIFNHLKGYRLFMDASGIKQICYIILSVLTKINVPVFFMVSGALLLEKQEGSALSSCFLRQEFIRSVCCMHVHREPPLCLR